MLSKKRFYVWSLTIYWSLLSAGHLSAQQPFPEIQFCPAGVQADGFIKWSGLSPTPPNSGGYTTTVPVFGTLNSPATFTIPSSAVTQYSEPYYTIVNDTDLLLWQGSNPTITFNRPVRGVSVSFQTTGRLGHDFKMTAFTTGGGQLSPLGVPPPAQVDSNGLDMPGPLFSTAPLQIRSVQNDIASVNFTFNGEEYGSYHLINLRVETDSAPDPSRVVPTNGLKEWLRGDKAVSTQATPAPKPLTSWPDQSGRGGGDATPVNAGVNTAPSVLSAGPNCTPVVNFSNPTTPTPVQFNLPINGWTNMTVIMALQALADTQSWFNQPLIWNETATWGTTFFTPSQTTAAFRFGTTQMNNQPIYTRPGIIGGDFNVTTAVHGGNTDSLYVNGELVLQQGGKLSAISGTVPTAVIGSGYNNTPFVGNVGEILIYDRVLTDVERQTVERYLIAKYGVH